MHARVCVLSPGVQTDEDGQLSAFPQIGHLQAVYVG